MQQTISYTLTRSKRRTISLSVDENGGVQVKAPNRLPKFLIDNFVRSKSSWIDSIQQKHAQRKQHQPVPRLSQDEIKIVKKEFKHDMLVFLDLQSNLMNLHYSKLRLSSARTRWGSCTSRGTISLNWRLALLPQHLRDYVVIHEIAHLKHMNHSKQFWGFVELFDPEYQANRKTLNSYSHFLREL